MERAPVATAAMIGTTVQRAVHEANAAREVKDPNWSVQSTPALLVAWLTQRIGGVASRRRLPHLAHRQTLSSRSSRTSKSRASLCRLTSHHSSRMSYLRSCASPVCALPVLPLDILLGPSSRRAMLTD
jgi:hypothetical protein